MYILNTKIAIQTYYQNNLLEILGLLPKQTCTFLLIWSFFFEGTLVKNFFVDVLGIKSFIYRKKISKQKKSKQKKYLNKWCFDPCKKLFYEFVPKWDKVRKKPGTLLSKIKTWFAFELL